jgi:hypothetical protein
MLLREETGDSGLLEQLVLSTQNTAKLAILTVSSSPVRRLIGVLYSLDLSSKGGKPLKYFLNSQSSSLLCNANYILYSDATSSSNLVKEPTSSSTTCCHALFAERQGGFRTLKMVLEGRVWLQLDPINKASDLGLRSERQPCCIASLDLRETA